MALLSREAFDEIEFDAACTGDHLGAAQRMSRLAETGIQTPAMPRSEAYVRAGEQWLLADDPAAAVHRFQRAIEEGGTASVDPRVALARALFLLGRVGEAGAIISRVAAEQPRDPRVCDQVAELLVERGDLRQALAWATAGVQLCLGGRPGPVGTEGGEAAAADRAGPGRPVSVPRDLGDRAELRLLLNLRFRIRNDLGLPEDGYDRLLDQLPRGFAGPADAEAG